MSGEGLLGLLSGMRGCNSTWNGKCLLRLCVFRMHRGALAPPPQVKGRYCCQEVREPAQGFAQNTQLPKGGGGRARHR